MLRLFKLNTGQDDHAVMFLDDYLNQVGFILSYSRSFLIPSLTGRHCGP